MRVSTLALVVAMVAGGAPAVGAEAPSVLAPSGSVARAGGYTFALGEADDAATPRAWQGPLSITGQGGRRCAVSDDVAIIERPMALVGGHLLYVSTYSGSENTLFVVDARDCTVRWTSPHYAGAARIGTKALVLPGVRTFAIGQDGLPS